MGILESTPSPVEILADNTGEGVTVGDLLPNRVERYGKAKRRALAISQYIKSNHTHHIDLASRISDCGSYLVFHDYYTIGEIRLSKASFCKKHLLCPLCAIRRGSKLVGRYIDRYHAVVAANGRLRPYMVTFTVKDGPDLLERFDHLRKSLQYLHKKRHLKNRLTEAKKAHAAAWSYEIKRGKNSGLWHPHTHAVWLCETKPDQASLSAEWQKITQDSYIVDVREITPNDPVSGFIEVFKYAVKFSDQPDSDTWECFEKLSGKRLIGSFGEFYGIKEPDELLDDPLEGLPYIEYFFKFINGQYCLRVS